MEARADARREAAAGLLDSYDAERRPVGEELVDRTAREGIGTDTTDPLFHRAARGPVADLAYRQPSRRERIRQRRRGGRNPAAAPFRLSTLLDRRDHTALLYAGDGIAADAVASFEAMARDQAQALPCRQVGRKRTGCRAMIAGEALAS